jgi:hypothetical protein
VRFAAVALAGEAMVWESETDGNPSVDAGESRNFTKRRLTEPRNRNSICSQSDCSFRSCSKTQCPAFADQLAWPFNDSGRSPPCRTFQFDQEEKTISQLVEHGKPDGKPRYKLAN